MTSAYRFPVQDWQFLLTELLRVQDRDDLQAFAGLTAADLEVLLAEAARFHEDVLLPISGPGDIEGAAFVEGQVRTPAGFREAWDAYREAGWPFISVPAEIGGGGMPWLLAAAMSELRMATAHSFAMYGAFCAPAATMLAALGEAWMQEQIVPRLVAGDWTATMCLTESHCGSDLRQLQTRAEQQADGTWRIYGQKSFISGGDHDLTDNIVHIVLAKVPDADGSIPGNLHAVNVFVVPKLTIEPSTGDVGGANEISVVSVEHKMGVEASATCTLAFDGAVGWRISDASRTGIAESMGPMFFLMNLARLSTALSGVAYAELTSQLARSYAHERLAGRAPAGARYPELPADPLVVHPDIRRLLLSAESFAQGARALAARVGLWQVEAEELDDARARSLVEMLTPVMKAYFTDKGFELANGCLQVLGGHGYIRDYGIEQAVRNARVGQIYEGANGIQARDLMRILTSSQADAEHSFFAGLETTAARADDGFHALAASLREAGGMLNEAITGARNGNDVDRAAAAYDLMTAVGIVAVAWSWLEVVIVASEGTDATRAERSQVLAQLWFERELPLVRALCDRVAVGGATLDRLPDAAI